MMPTNEGRAPLGKPDWRRWSLLDPITRRTKHSTTIYSLRDLTNPHKRKSIGDTQTINRSTEAMHSSPIDIRARSTSTWRGWDKATEGYNCSTIRSKTHADAAEGAGQWRSRVIVPTVTGRAEGRKGASRRYGEDSREGSVPREGRWRAAWAPAMVLLPRVSLPSTLGCCRLPLTTPPQRGAVLRHRGQDGSFPHRAQELGTHRLGRTEY